MRDADDIARFNERILDAARTVVQSKGSNEFTIQEIVRLIRSDYPEFSEGAIRKSVISQCSRSGGDSAMAWPGNFKKIRNGLFHLRISSAREGSINRKSTSEPWISVI